MSEELEIDISPTGEFKVEAKGYRGAGCTDALDNLLEDLKRGGIETSIKDQKKKQEYYAAGTKQTIKTSH